VLVLPIVRDNVRWFLDTQQDLIVRIEQLKRDAFRTKCVVVILFLGLATGTIANWLRHPATVTANEFVLRDRSGNVLARLGQEGFGDTCLTLTAKQNVSVASLCVQNEEGASLDLHNLKSESRATLTPGFNLYEPLFHVQSSLVITERGQIIQPSWPRPINKPE